MYGFLYCHIFGFLNFIYRYNLIGYIGYVIAGILEWHIKTHLN